MSKPHNNLGYEVVYASGFLEGRLEGIEVEQERIKKLLYATMFPEYANELGEEFQHYQDLCLRLIHIIEEKPVLDDNF